MSEYFSSFIVEPVVRQARRFSRLSTGEEFLPAVPESLRTWYPGRLWSTSPPASISEDEHQEKFSVPDSTLVGQWVTPIPSPPFEAMESCEIDVPEPSQSSSSEPAPFPPLEPQIAQQPRPSRLNEIRAHSDTSINHLRELPDRARIHEDDVRGHSQSDPVARLREESGASSGTSSVEMIRSLYENSGPNRSRGGSGTLPADDGMGPLRQKINAVWQGEGTVEEKSQKLHSLMMEQYNSSQVSGQGFPNPRKRMAASSRPSTSSSLRDTGDANTGSAMSWDLATEADKPFRFSPADLAPTYAPLDPDDVSTESGETEKAVRGPPLGCMHYKRNVKLECFACKRWYTCRFCHDDAEDHVLPRQETEKMLCMICKTAQPASQTCRSCCEQAACYYCSVCKLWNNDPAKSIYHCDDCGICRLGEGLGRDFFHCKTCAVCMSINVQSGHRCIERSTKCDCPICGEYLFTSAGTVVFMRCGHSIHDTCFKEWCKTSYKCPICSKSVVNMETQFRNLDRQIESQPMPDEYRNTRAYVHCNDCSSKAITNYHWLGLKCERCESYNTQQHHLIELDDDSGSRPRPGSVEPVTATPPLPQNVSDEAVAIPNSRAVSRRPSVSISELGGSSGSPWLLPRPRGARSMSPTVGNYFGTGLGRQDQAAAVTTAVEGQEYDFWGRPIRSWQRVMGEGGRVDGAGSGEDDGDEDEWTDGDDDDDDDDEMEDDFEDDDDDDDDIDQMALIGHR